ncbi:hypothetical protein AOLI_G00129200 [Acnodon oligacanthus]
MVEELLGFSAVLRFVVFLAFLSFSSGAALSSDADIPTNAQYFNTKTRYQDLNTYLRENILAINSSAVKPPAPTCIPVHFTIIARHGTRFPTAENIKKIGAFDELVKTEANGDLSYLPELKAWKMWYKEDMAGRLTETGREDHIHLAQRMVETFPTLLTKENLQGGRVKFITSSVPRCINSTLSFQLGLKEWFHLEGEEFPYTVNDTLMRFFASCERFVETVLNNPEAVIQATLFKNGPEMEEVQRKVADLLQIPYDKFTADVAETGFFLCAYEWTIRGLNSPWCRLYDRADADVVDYASDLGLYYKRGYGHKIDSMASCVLFNDLFSRLEKAANEFSSWHCRALKWAGQPVSEVVTVEIGHAETLLPLVTLLGLFKDKTPLTAANYASQLNRAFNGGHIVPYIGNLLAALYDCPDGFRLQLRVNERPVEVPGLNEFSPLFKDVKEQYQQILGCNQEAICKMNK